VREIAINRVEVLILPPVGVRLKCAVSHAADIELLLADE